jgi:glycosyltransferase involved in cell wall biosynthesis
LIAAGRSGIPRYARALTQALDDASPEFPELRLTLITTRDGAESVGARRIAVEHFPLQSRRLNAGPGRIAAEQAAAATKRADLLHFFDLTGPLLAPWRPFTATVHDVSSAPGLARRRHAYKRIVWPWAARHARRLVAVSRFAGEETAKHLGVPADKIEVIHSGPGLMAVSSAESDGAAAPDKPYFLYVGDLAGRKNVPFLIRAFDRADVMAELLLVGPADDDYDDIRAEIDRARHGDRIRLVQDASDPDLDTLYRSALALAMPSRYEGFGFTPLEAMARECPVLASDIPAFREVSGSGALLVPLDEDRWAGSMRELAGDEALRADLRRRGKQTVARYSWGETARALCRLFLDVGGRGTQ